MLLTNHIQVMDRAFTGTPSRISGITFDTIVGDLVKHHDKAFPKDPEQVRTTMPSLLFFIQLPSNC